MICLKLCKPLLIEDDIKDKVFLLSFDEVRRYFTEYDDRVAEIRMIEEDLNQKYQEEAGVVVAVSVDDAQIFYFLAS